MEVNEIENKFYVNRAKVDVTLMNYLILYLRFQYFMRYLDRLIDNELK